ncbi:hypothetical protein JCM9279_001438 [Rhodotorula babjevae]
MRYLATLAALVAGAGAVVAAPACTSRQFLDPATMRCVACPADALTCTSSTVALTCQRGSFLTSASDCVTANLCPSGTFPDAATRKCVACYSTSFKTCSDASSTGATSCTAEFCLLNGKCYAQQRPPTGYFCSAGIATACTGTGVAKCDTKGVPTSCAAGFSFDSIGKTCSACPGYGVATCNSAGAPTSCKAPYHLATKSQTCVICNDYQRFDTQTETCKCSDGFFSVPTFSGGANGTPSTGCILCSAISSSQQCNIATALSCFRYYDETTQGCPRECRETSDGVLPATYYAYELGPVCKSCGGVEIDSCTGPNQALACRAPYQLDSGKCVLVQ